MQLLGIDDQLAKASELPPKRDVGKLRLDCFATYSVA